MWHWLTQTDAGLAARIIAGAIILVILAVADLRRNGRNARRWREYLFLLVCVIAAMIYGVSNDLLTSTISWEYFCYGKGLWPEVIHDLPPDPLKLRLAASVVGLKATWTAGLIIGVAMLIANNPSRRWPQLKMTRMLRMLLLIALVAVICAAALATFGYLTGFARFSEDFSQMLARDQIRPRRFIAVFGIHLGGYIGGLLGLVLAILRIAVLRRRGSFQKGPAPVGDTAAASYTSGE